MIVDKNKNSIEIRNLLFSNLWLNNSEIIFGKSIIGKQNKRPNNQGIIIFRLINLLLLKSLVHLVKVVKKGESINVPKDRTIACIVIISVYNPFSKSPLFETNKDSLIHLVSETIIVLKNNGKINLEINKL